MTTYATYTLIVMKSHIIQDLLKMLFLDGDLQVSPYGMFLRIP